MRVKLISEGIVDLIIFLEKEHYILYNKIKYIILYMRDLNIKFTFSFFTIKWRM